MINEIQWLILELKNQRITDIERIGDATLKENSHADIITNFVTRSW